MAARVIYTARGTDPATIQWPSAGPQQWTLQSGVPQVIPNLIVYPGQNIITWADGRQLPQVTAQGSTVLHAAL